MNHTEISEIPDELLQLDKLEEISIAGNRIVDISKLSSLKRLKIINASNNKIANIEGIEGLKLIEELDFSDNRIEEFPDDEIEEMKYLKKINLSKNLISEIDKYFTPFINRIEIDLSENRIYKIDIDTLKTIISFDDDLENEIDLENNPFEMFFDLSDDYLIDIFKLITSNDDFDDWDYNENKDFVKSLFSKINTNDFLSDNLTLDFVMEFMSNISKNDKIEYFKNTITNEEKKELFIEIISSKDKENYLKSIITQKDIDDYLSKTITEKDKQKYLKQSITQEEYILAQKEQIREYIKTNKVEKALDLLYDLVSNHDKSKINTVTLLQSELNDLNSKYNLSLMNNQEISPNMQRIRKSILDTSQDI